VFIQYGTLADQICYLVVTRDSESAALVLTHSSKGYVRAVIEAKVPQADLPGIELNCIEVRNGEITTKTKMAELELKTFKAWLNAENAHTVDSLLKFGSGKGVENKRRSDTSRNQEQANQANIKSS